ncbi:hypothetical protein ACFZAM_02905 [Streptomyces sp. NPDC008079]|uniref:hypothetical protein n=1 Tax=Streptomyces sp. NPDC008079 TaxID=3364806 RepID=UPI0036E7BA37
MFTEDQITAAEAEAATAERALEAAKAALDAAPYSDVAAGHFATAAQDAARKSANARELREALTEQAAAVQLAATREEREKAAGKQITAAGRELEAGHKEVVRRAEAAQQALAELMAAATAYSDLTEAHGGALLAQGLDLGAGQAGARESYEGWEVRVKGRSYLSVDPGQVSAYVLRRVGEARLSDMHWLLPRLWATCVTFEDRADGIAASLSKPRVVAHVPLPGIAAAAS